MIKLSNLDKIYWPTEKIRKADLLHYYAMMSSCILPYLKDRPLVLHRFPNGIQSENFYQKQVATPHPSYVRTATIAHKQKKVTYVIVQNTKSLLYVVNLGSIELHPFHSSLKSLDHPDYLVLDLDPEGVSFSAVIEVAQVIHDLLSQIDFPHYCKTSGGRGLHIYLPLHAKYDYPLAKYFAYILAQIVHEKLPKLTSLIREPQKRQKKIYIDTLQNQKGQTMVCAYSVRGMPHATVSTPLLWKEVKYGLDPTQFTLRTVPRRLARRKDPFAGIFKKGISIHPFLKKLEKTGGKTCL